MGTGKIGGILGNPSEPSSSGTASGVFTISAANQYIKLDKWVTAPTIPTPPTDPTISGITDGFSIDFTHPTTSGGTPITGFSARFTNLVDSSATEVFISAGASSLDVTGFNVDTNYIADVRATNRYGISAFSSAAPTASFSSLTEVELVVQAGGGAGGYAGDGAAGGGGAGGLVYGTVPITGGVTYTITVGTGSSSSSQSNGGNSSALGCLALGGGYGGRGTRGSHQKGKDGGCGGGGSGWDAYQDGGISTQTGSGTIKVGATATTTYYGHAGACAPGLTGSQGTHPGGGGGTAEIGGTDGNYLGGDGTAISWFVSATYTGFHGQGYIGGGGGGATVTPADYALGGGGRGLNGGNNTVYQRGLDGTGSGGGSTYNGGGLTYGGDGGDGIVVIRYPDSAPTGTTTGTPAVTATGGYRYYIFTGNGSITWSL